MSLLDLADDLEVQRVLIRTRCSALSSVFSSVLAVVTSVFASVLPAVYAVADDGRSAHDGRRAGDGSADDSPACGVGWSEWHVNLLRLPRPPRERREWLESECVRWQ